jgi:hypothetical protein
MWRSGEQQFRRSQASGRDGIETREECIEPAIQGECVRIKENEDSSASRIGTHVAAGAEPAVRLGAQQVNPRIRIGDEVGRAV